jgi:hypothetical protein
MYFVEYFSLVTFIRIKRRLVIGLFFYGKLSPSETELKIFLDSFVSRYQFPKLLFKLDGLFVNFGLYFILFSVPTNKYLFFLAVEGPVLLLDD